MTVFSSRMREALSLTRRGNLRDATAVIRDALTNLRGPARTSGADSPIDVEFRVVPSHEQAISAALPHVDASAPDIDATADEATVSFVLVEPTSSEPIVVARHPLPVVDREHDETRRGSEGRFVSGSFSNTAGTRAYRLWIPRADAGVEAASRPLIVMLHGCTQDADDFARGTRMNVLADERHAYVLYPIQANAANAQRCWRWFENAHQVRDSGEPSIIADMTRQLMREFPIDARRVYVAGLSAGAAMAVVLGEAYPDVFAGVGVHSGIAYAAAHDVPSAFAVMSGRAVTRRRTTPAASAARAAVRTIVLHGDRDTTVAPANGDAIAQQLHAAYLAKDSRPLTREIHEESHASVIRFRTAEGLVAIEHWTLHGGGHAWSGGDSAGSYTEPRGADASRRMLQFFLGDSA